jgi:flagellar hook-associated protein 2
MIENAISGYQTKITELEAQYTKYEWKQEAYRSIIEKAVNFDQSYTSYTSSTNLLSASFFNNATIVTSSNDKLATAYGKTSSTIEINSVATLASAARYSGSGTLQPATEGDLVDLTENVKVSNLTGALRMAYGSTTVSITFDEGDVVEGDTAAERASSLAAIINEKLANQTITFSSSGESVAASERIKATASDDGTITLKKVKSTDSNSMYISAAGSSVKSILGIDTDAKQTSFSVNKGSSTYYTEENRLEYILGKSLSITVDGTTKSITVPTKKADGTKITTAADYITALQESIDDAFGEGKLTVTNAAAEDNATNNTNNLQLSFEAANKDNGTIFTVSSSLGKAFGIGGGLGSYIDTGLSLSDLFTEDELNAMAKKTTSGAYDTDSAGNKIYELTINGETLQFSNETTLESIITKINNNEDMGVKISYSKTTAEFVISAKDTGEAGKIEVTGALGEALFGAVSTKSIVTTDTGVTLNNLLSGQNIQATGDDVDENDPSAGQMYTVTINGVDFEFDGTSSLDDVLSELNASDTLGVKFGYDKTNGKLVITEGSIKSSEGDMAAIFSSSLSDVTKGTDAEFNVTINGNTKTLKRSSNSVDIDGMTISLKKTFDETMENYEPVTFTTSADVDTIVSAIKSMVEDYNTMVTEIKNAYSTLPAEKSDGSTYEPLSEDDEADMSETAIANYEAKAKQGILFGDSDLSSFYNGLRDVIDSLSSSSTTLGDIGISTSYSDGLTVLSLNETKLRAALESEGF